MIRACALVSRTGQEGSWISEAFIEGYTELHRQGLAHSVEVWHDENLVGGLYGLALGRIFFGESMFAREPNASKAGFITLVRALQQSGFWLIDCQQQTAHLESLGARGALPEAGALYDDVLDSDPHDADARLGRAEMLRTQGDKAGCARDATFAARDAQDAAAKGRELLTLDGRAVAPLAAKLVDNCK